MIVKVEGFNEDVARAARAKRLRTVRRRDETGEMRTLYRLDFADADFEVQFTKAFTLSVKRARADHRKNGRQL